MSSKKIETAGCCVGGRHRSATTYIVGDITSKVSKVVSGRC